jgi:beta-phosphoglucomutase-like phosphatase (HAD superfamily)
VAIRGLLFDFDGLLIDTETPARRAYEELYREHGHELPLDKWATLVGTIGAEWDPNTHLEELVGQPLDQVALAERRRANGDVERAKPNPDLYEEALSLLGLQPSEAIAFEDSVNGIRAAKGAGIFVVAVPNPITETFALDEADVLLCSLDELPLDDLLARVRR